MAAQHARAVQLRRREFGDEINQQLAMSIALHMGNDGSPALLAINTLATAAPCHYNTADKRLKEMAARGLIKMSKHGKLFFYSIPGQYEDETTGPASVDCTDDIEQINGRLDNLENDVKELVKMVQELSHHLHTIVTSSSHELHMNFTPADNEIVNKEEKKISREEVKNPPNPPAENGGPETEFPEPFKPKHLRYCPDWLATEQFLPVWAEWEQYHSDMGKPLPAISAKKQLERMGKWGPDWAIVVINHSMENKYTGLVEPKASSNGRHPTNNGQSLDEIINSAVQDIIRR